MMSARTTFLSAMTGLSIILALRVAISPSVLCRTLRCGLTADMILQKNNQQDLPQIILKRVDSC
jgi:hypothetical protein